MNRGCVETTKPPWEKVRAIGRRDSTCSEDKSISGRESQVVKVGGMEDSRVCQSELVRKREGPETPVCEFERLSGG
jgi:hypothetical protein